MTKPYIIQSLNVDPWYFYKAYRLNVTGNNKSSIVYMYYMYLDRTIEFMQAEVIFPWQTETLVNVQETLKRWIQRKSILA